MAFAWQSISRYRIWRTTRIANHLASGRSCIAPCPSRAPARSARLASASAGVTRAAAGHACEHAGTAGRLRVQLRAARTRRVTARASIASPRLPALHAPTGRRGRACRRRERLPRGRARPEPPAEPWHFFSRRRSVAVSALPARLRPRSRGAAAPGSPPRHRPSALMPGRVSQLLHSFIRTVSPQHSDCCMCH